MRLPKDPDNWTGWHATKALEIAHAKFDQYEAKINFDSPKEVQNEIYNPYRLARAEAIAVCTAVGLRQAEAEALP